MPEIDEVQAGVQRDPASHRHLACPAIAHATVRSMRRSGRRGGVVGRVALLVSTWSAILTSLCSKVATTPLVAMQPRRRPTLVSLGLLPGGWPETRGVPYSRPFRPRRARPRMPGPGD